MTHAEWQGIVDELASIEDLVNEGRFSDVISVLLEIVHFLFDQIPEPPPDPEPDPEPEPDGYTDDQGNVMLDDQGNAIT